MGGGGGKKDRDMGFVGNTNQKHHQGNSATTDGHTYRDGNGRLIMAWLWSAVNLEHLNWQQARLEDGAQSSEICTEKSRL